MLYNVKDFGAIGDSSCLEHEAMQKALDTCSRNGGGTVLVPAGTYLCGTIELRSNVNFYLEMGAKILAAKEAAHFPEICKTPFGNLPGQIQSLLLADDVENVTVSGEGIIDGGKNEPLTGDDSVNETFRPALIFGRDCRNIKFLDVTMQWSSFWTLHLLRCNDVVVRGVRIIANQQRINTDGIDPDGCCNVIISDCNITTGDDSIVLKSTEGDLSENVTVTNCILNSRHAALKIGTEAIGDVKNITFSNCVIRSNVGLALYMKDGSNYENIIFSNVTMDVTNNFPLVMDITPRYYREPRIGKIRNIVFDNIIVNGRGRCYIEGVEHKPIENISFNNITWNISGPCKIEDAIKPVGARRVELDPNGTNYAVNPHQFIAVNVKDICFNGLRLYDLTGQELDKRGLYYIANGENVTINNAPYVQANDDYIAINNSKDVRINGKIVGK